MKKDNKGSIIYAIVGVCTLIIAVVGATYAYYAASATANISGTAGGGEGPELSVEKISTGASGNLIPLDMTTEELTNAALGWDSTEEAVGTAWNASNACIDMNGYSVCQVYSVTLTNNSTSTVSYDITLTSLAGVSTPDNTPNIEAVKMASNISVTDATSVKGNSLGTVTLAGGATSTPIYFMVFIKNLDVPQNDAGQFTGVVTASGGNGGRIEAEFS